MKYFPILISSLILTACLEFGSDWNTTHPSNEQRQESLRFVGLDPQNKVLRVLGVKYIGSGIDKIIWLKLQAPKSFNFSEKMKSSNLQMGDIGETWWIQAGSKLKTYQYPVTTYRNVYISLQEKEKSTIAYIQSNEM